MTSRTETSSHRAIQADPADPTETAPNIVWAAIAALITLLFTIVLAILFKTPNEAKASSKKTKKLPTETGTERRRRANRNPVETTRLTPP